MNQLTEPSADLIVPGMHEHPSRAVLKVTRQEKTEEIAQERLDEGTEHEL